MQGGALYNGGQITNTQTIAGSTDGIFLSNGGTVINSSGGITGGTDAIDAPSPATIVNGGTLEGTLGAGIQLGSGGDVTNSGSIGGGKYGIVLGNSGEVTNDGSISGKYGIQLGDGGNVTN